MTDRRPIPVEPPDPLLEALVELARSARRNRDAARAERRLRVVAPDDAKRERVA